MNYGGHQGELVEELGWLNDTERPRLVKETSLRESVKKKVRCLLTQSDDVCEVAPHIVGQVTGKTIKNYN